MKTITTLFISIVALVATANASNVEITNSTLVAGTSLTTGTIENTVVLSWVAKNENSSSRYEVERSFYSNNFTTITSLQVPFTNNSVKNYRINDNAAELAGRAVAYYRVKQISANGTITYSNTMVVNLDNNAKAVKATASIHFTALQNGNAVIKIKSIAGNTAATTNTIVAKGNNTVELANTTGLTKGIYVTEVSVNGVVIDIQKIIVE
jgi:hypothetical protein